MNAARQKTPRIKLRGKRHQQRKRPLFSYPDIKWTKERIRECQLRDKSITPYMKYLEIGELCEDDTLAREIVLSADSYVIEDGVLYHILDSKAINQRKQTDEIHVCLVITQEPKHNVLTSVHGDLSSGHYGTQRTYSTMRLKYVWIPTEGMYTDCKNWVLSCENCNTKGTGQANKSRATSTPSGHNERWAMNFVTLPLTPRGNRI